MSLQYELHKPERNWNVERERSSVYLLINCTCDLHNMQCAAIKNRFKIFGTVFEEWQYGFEPDFQTFSVSIDTA